MSHERKIKSYAAEAAFYSNCCGRVLSSGSAAVVAEALLVDVAPPTHFLFVLRDLRVDHPQHRYTLDKKVLRSLSTVVWHIARRGPDGECIVAFL